MRFWTLSLAALAAFLLSTSAASALMVAFLPPYQRALTADTVVVGKVISIAKETIEVEEVKGAPKTTYHVAMVKINSALKGAAGLTHIRVGFRAAPTSLTGPLGGKGIIIERMPLRSGSRLPELKEGQEFAFFLNPHATAGFQVMNAMSPPIDITNDHGKAELESVKKSLAIIANPKAALTAEKAEDRYLAACTMLFKHRQVPPVAGKFVQQPIASEENDLIFKGLLEGDWDAAQPNLPSGTMAIGLLGIGPKEGFKYPMLKPGQKPGNAFKQALATWRTGPGKDFTIKANLLAK